LINGNASLLVDGEEVASMETNFIFSLMISWSGLDIGFDRGTPVGHYAAPFKFSGTLIKVTVDLDDDQDLNHEAVGNIAMAKE
jgi:arylsulfatase